MKIASFCFHTGRSQVGGAQVPAVAFLKWAELFNIECELITLRRFYDPDDYNSDISCDIVVLDNEEEINNYGAVFFSTPDYFGGSDFDFSKITIPRASMAHAEFDSELYGGSERFYRVMSSADVPVVIGESYWDLGSKECLWYPCCLPEYLLRYSDLKIDSDVHYQKSGMLYAARLSVWKNAHILAMLSNVPSFRKSMNEIIDVFGLANNVEYQNLVSSINPTWHQAEGIYNGYDSISMAKRNRDYSFYWDVSGSDTYKFKLKRFNLSAVEALKVGVMPVVWSHQLPDDMKHIFPTVEDVLCNPSKLSDDKRLFADDAISELFELDKYCYPGVRRQMYKIFEELGC